MAVIVHVIIGILLLEIALALENDKILGIERQTLFLVGIGVGVGLALMICCLCYCRCKKLCYCGCRNGAFLCWCRFKKKNRDPFDDLEAV